MPVSKISKRHPEGEATVFSRVEFGMEKTQFSKNPIVDNERTYLNKILSRFHSPRTPSQKPLNFSRP